MQTQEHLHVCFRSACIVYRTMHIVEGALVVAGARTPVYSYFFREIGEMFDDLPPFPTGGENATALFSIFPTFRLKVFSRQRIVGAAV